MSLLKIHFRLDQDEDGYPSVAVESMWAKMDADVSGFTLDNIPFFVREATMGDTVTATQEDGLYWFDQVVLRSGNSLLRAVFFDHACIDTVSESLIEMGCGTEYLREHNLMAINVPISVRLTQVQSYLRVLADAGKIDYEEPLLRQ